MVVKKKIEAVNAQELGLSERPKPVDSHGFAVAVRVQRQNWRQGTVACKGRSDVAGSNRKPWRQKGTGRARAGAVDSPIWRGGGVTFGPQPRVRNLSILKRLRKSLMRDLLWQRLEGQNIIALPMVHTDDRIKTSIAFKALQDAGLMGTRVTLFVAPDDYKTQLMFANIASVQMVLFDQPNVYQLSDGNCWVFLDRDIELFKDMVSAWN
ncbi:MAG: 50S ribosomal protein L4 [candidate division TM6 bacterium GW2011_GWF2_43_17]|nr:MAG: 50S ribosomal protein L4 [candidate division TM6 bacterium GW2011_GWF2_43_17]HAU30143.1 50S ribosomal protein L4 [Candidatus Dependentiae bacterium]